MYEIYRTPSVLFSHDVQVNSYLTQLWTVVAQRPHKWFSGPRGGVAA